MYKPSLIASVALIFLAAGLTACAGGTDAPPSANLPVAATGDYKVGPGDTMQVFVWRSPELTEVVKVRPDGKISVPLIEDLPVTGQTPTKVARMIEEKLSAFVKDAVVTVVMIDPQGVANGQIRVIGEAAKPVAIPYRDKLTVVDVIIMSGGLTPYAAGNRATILRTVDGKSATYRVRLDDLMKDGDVSANVEMAPGDVLSIPQSWF